MYCIICCLDIDESQFTYYNRNNIYTPKCMKCVKPRNPTATCNICGVTLTKLSFTHSNWLLKIYECKYCVKHKFQWNWIELYLNE